MNLGCGQTVKPMPVSSSAASWKSGDSVPDRFPAGLRVLVVDDDPTCLRILEKMLQNCLYEVTKCDRAEFALSLLRENKNGFDIVLSDVHMPDMDGFKLLEYIGLEMDLPVIMMSADDSKSVVMKGVTHGACDYLIKPVRIEALKNIWQHVVRKRKYDWKDKDFEQSGTDDRERQPKASEDTDYSSSANEGNWKESKKRKDEDDEAEDREDTSTLKKPRVVWSVELHQQFVAAVNQLGIDKAVPKKILELMNVPGLTRENVASHLQKYRLYLRRLSGVSQNQTGFSNSFMGLPDSSFGPMSSLSSIDLQALAASGQLPAQSLATLQAATFGRSGKSAISMPLVDQRNLFSFESPKSRVVEGQQQLNNNKQQINLLHGIPTNMEPKQLANLQQSLPSVGGMNMNTQASQHNNSLLMPMSQPQPRVHIMSETNRCNISRLPGSVGQAIQTNGFPGGLLPRNGIAENPQGALYSPGSQGSSIVDFSMKQKHELPNSIFHPVGGNPRAPNLTTKGVIQEDVNSGLKGPRGFPPGYDMLGEIQQQKNQAMSLHNVGSTFSNSHHADIHGSSDVSRSVLSQQRAQKVGQNGNAPVSKVVFSTGEEVGDSQNPMVGQQIMSLLGGNLLTVKQESVPDTSYQNTLFPDNYGQEDLMSALLKQSEGVGSSDNEFGFDGYPFNNLPVQDFN